ncbi:hypothetical protein [Agromyces laixinhei]|uniref:hypothetical protein n=1 Tax=Agromyces laixinhei TaxID=2585717 RepID=UPI0012EEA5E9|nr:hypothetical protein [Agromyces laixinhei]
MSAFHTPAAAAIRASIRIGRERGYYRVLFDAGPVDALTFAVLTGLGEQQACTWLDEQLDAGVLRVVAAPAGGRAELLLPGEHVPILLDGGGEPEFDGARALLAEHRAELPTALAELDEEVAAFH